MHKGEIEGEILLLNKVSKQEAAEILDIIWRNINSYDVKQAFDESICCYFENVEIDKTFNIFL